MSYTYPHYASQSPVASYQSAQSITHFMESRLHINQQNNNDEEESIDGSSRIYGAPMSYGTIQRRASVRSNHRRPSVSYQGVPETAPLLGPVNPAIAFDTSYAPSLAEEGEDATENSASSSDDPIEPELPYGMPQPWSAWAKETKVIIQYSIPVLVTQLLEYSLSVASVIAIGHLGTVELAASTLGSMTASVTGWSIIVGMASALDTLLPQAWGGAPEQRKLVGLWTQRMAVVIAILILPILVVWHSSEAILIFLRQDPDVAYHASIYLKWLSAQLPAYSVNYLFRKYYQSIGLLHVPSLFICVIAPLNAILNYILVWGPGPFAPLRLGFIGAPIASTISVNIMSLFYVVHAYFWAPRAAWFPLNSMRDLNKVLSGEALGFLVRLGAAGVGQTASEWWSWELIGIAASLLGPVTLASQSVLLVSASTTYQLPWAISAASSVRIGNMIGSGLPNQSRLAARISLLLIVLAGSFSSSLLLIFRHSWAYMFNNDPEVVRLVARVLPLVALFQILDGLGAMTGTILRVTGRQFTGALLNLTGYYVIGIPAGLVLTFYYTDLDLGLLGLWIGLSIALAFVSLVGLWYTVRADWRDEVEKARIRLKSGERHE